MSFLIRLPTILRSFPVTSLSSFGRQFSTNPARLSAIPFQTSTITAQKSSPHSRKTSPKFPISELSYHWDTLPPSPRQLAHAHKFFALKPPTFLWSAEKFKTIDHGSSPEVCFLGRSNVGKSSLLNALLLRKIAHTSSKPGRTKLMNAFAVGGSEADGNRLVVLDMPGYGKGGRAEWGKEIMKYLEKRKQLKRAFLLVDAEHGMKTTDENIVAMFKEADIPFQVILSKADKLMFTSARMPSQAALNAAIGDLRKVMDEVKAKIETDYEEGKGTPGEIIACSAERWVESRRMGVDEVRFAMLRAAGLEFRPQTVFAKLPEIIPHDQIFAMSQRT